LALPERDVERKFAAQLAAQASTPGLHGIDASSSADRHTRKGDLSGPYQL
jgi:hypothetical protein